MFIINTESINSYKRFVVVSFGVMSWAMVILVIISLLLSYGGLLLLIQFTGLFLIFYPKIYRKFKVNIFPKWIINSHPLILKIISLVPSVSFNGQWFLDENSKNQVELKSIRDLLSFIASNWPNHFVVYPGIIALTMRIFYNIQTHILQIPVSNEGLIGLKPEFLLLAFLLSPFMFAAYDVTYLTLKDLGLMTYSYISMDKTIKNDVKTDITELWSLASSTRNLITIGAGISTLSWVAEKMSELESVANTDKLPEPLNALVLLIIFSLFFSGMSILIEVMYYRSGNHELFVNNLKEYITAKNKEDEDYRIKLGSITFVNKNMEESRKTLEE